jgi:anthranilate synthase component 1
MIHDQAGTRYVKSKIWMQDLRDYMKQYDVENDTGIPFIGGAVGTFAYDLIRQFEAIPETNPDELNVPDLHLMFFSELLVYDHHYQTLSILVVDRPDREAQAKARMAEIKAELKAGSETKKQEAFCDCQARVIRSTSESEYMKNVEKAKTYIKDGDIFQVVLSRRWVMETNEKPFALYRKLRMLNPSPYLFYLSFGDYEVLGSSPELLVSLEGDRIDNCPIAGARPRGANEAEDLALERELLADKKEVSEHVMLVDLARNDMGRVAKFDTVALTKRMVVERFSHVMHIVSEVTGQRKTGQDAFSILRSFLPAGTLSGAPKVRAMEIIEEMETVKRGVYGGAVGYIGFDGNMDLCIAIRMMVHKANRLYLQAGAGIVADSDPKKEAKECENKIMALMKTMEGKSDDFID